MRRVVVEPAPAPPEGGADQDQVVRSWRHAWEHAVAAAAAPDGGDVFLTERRRRYGAYSIILLDLALTLIGAIIFAIPVQLVALALFVAQHRGVSVTSPAGQAALLAFLATPGFILVGLLATDGPIVLVLWYRLARLRLDWTWYGLGAALRPRIGSAVLVGVGIGVVGLVISGVLTGILQALKFDVSAQSQVLINPLKHAPLWGALGVALGGSIFAPVVEELFFRGYVFRAVAVRKGVPLAYLVSAGLFALIHLEEGLGLLPIIPVLFVVGLLLCFAYHRTGNLAANITAHIVFNGVGFATALLPLPLH